MIRVSTKNTNNTRTRILINYKTEFVCNVNKSHSKLTKINSSNVFYKGAFTVAPSVLTEFKE